jgi:PAS domain S-box-containing protein
MADALIVVNQDATIRVVNQATLDLLGYEENELTGKPIGTILGEGEELLFKGSELGDDLVNKELERNVEKTYLSKNGRKIPVLFSGSVMCDDDGKIQGIIYVARDITDRKKAEKKIKVYQKKLRSLASQLTIAEEEERRRIATELHDAIGQLLALCKIKLGEVGKVAASSEARPLVEEIKGLLEEIIQYSRSLTLRLGPPIVYELGLEVALEWLAESVHEQQGIQVNLEVDSQIKPIDEDLRIFLFRAAQELLMNVTKHSKTDKAKVSLGRENENIYLSVEDRGVGFNSNILDTPSGKDIGFGLFSMRERIKYFGGEFSLQSKPGEGTQVTLVVPLKAPQEKK